MKAAFPIKQRLAIGSSIQVHQSPRGAVRDGSRRDGKEWSGDRGKPLRKQAQPKHPQGVPFMQTYLLCIWNG